MKIKDIEKSRDYYKELSEGYYKLIITMTQAFEKLEKARITKIIELEKKLKKVDK